MVNVVEDYGAANDASASIVPILERIYADHGDDTLFYFPAGRYYMDREFEVTGFNNIGFVGERAAVAPEGTADEDEESDDETPEESSEPDDVYETEEEPEVEDDDDLPDFCRIDPEFRETGDSDDESDADDGDDEQDGSDDGDSITDDADEESEANKTENTVEIVHPDYDGFNGSGHIHRLFRFGKPDDWGRPGRNLRFEGFDIDWRSPQTGLRVIEADVYDGLVVRNVNVHGRHDSGAFGPLRIAIADPAGSGLVEGFRVPDGGEFTSDVNTGSTQSIGPIGFLSNDYHQGTLTYQDCVLVGFPNNGLYASNGPGAVRVIGGRYANNNVAQLRLGGRDNYVDGATLVTDTNMSSEGHEVRQRAIRLESGAESTVIENVDIDMSDGRASEAILLRRDVGDVTFRNLDVHIDVDRPINGVRVRGNPNASINPDEFTIEDSTFDHNAAGGSTLLFDDVGSNAAPALVEDVTIDGTMGINGNRPAIFNFRDNVTFRNVTIDQGGHPQRRGLDNRGDNVTVQNVN
ncbi:hypothetical protein [Natrononativus amylolyticus]|uniref:hypothetical protein n=1 Tax=Natrononativus amylolyticus TaxID=2963434 RepID=UPI0020CC5EDD|nr:hypothetical protein [Natrononativus amylolyticus]